jgi:cytochrome P450
MRQADPVFRQPGLDGETPIWFVTRYADVVSVLMDDERFVVAATTASALRSRGSRPTPVAWDT